VAFAYRYNITAVFTPDHAQEEEEEEDEEEEEEDATGGGTGLPTATSRMIGFR
jgi:hypothetical protein